MYYRGGWDGMLLLSRLLSICKNNISITQSQYISVYIGAVGREETLVLSAAPPPGLSPPLWAAPRSPSSLPYQVIPSHFPHSTMGRPHRTATMYWCVLLISLTLAGAQQEANAVVDFSDDTFAESVPVKPHFVMFYAPWWVLVQRPGSSFCKSTPTIIVKTWDQHYQPKLGSCNNPVILKGLCSSCKLMPTVIIKTLMSTNIMPHQGPALTQSFSSRGFANSPTFATFLFIQI